LLLGNNVQNKLLKYIPTLLQISIEVNSGSVGKIAEQIGETVKWLA
jgi:hypothetical protein